MTNSTTSIPVPTTPGLLGADDPRALFGEALTVTEAVIAEVTPDQLENPTPCDEFDVRALLGHLVTVVRRVTVVGRGEDPFGPSTMADDVVDGAWPEAWHDAADKAHAAWADDDTLTRIVRLPWAELSGADALCGWLNEVIVHTWDLAVATGQQQPTWNPAALEAAFAAIRHTLPASNRLAMFESVLEKMPPEARDGASAPFAEAIEVPADASLIDRLVAWNGRQPQVAAS